jgi:hypothetical protein
VHHGFSRSTISPRIFLNNGQLLVFVSTGIGGIRKAASYAGHTR